jgi:hypothetical protein
MKRQILSFGGSVMELKTLELVLSLGLREADAAYVADSANISLGSSSSDSSDESSEKSIDHARE